MCDSKLTAMSEPAPLLLCAPDLVSGSSCDLTVLQPDQNGHCELMCSSDTAPGIRGVSDLDCRTDFHHQVEAVSLEHHGTLVPEEETLSSAPSQGPDISCLLPASGEVSTIMSSGRDCSTEKHMTSDSESSSTSPEDGGGVSWDEDDDDLSEPIRYKEFLFGHRRTNLSRNRKCLRKRPKSHGNSTDVWAKGQRPKCQRSQGDEEEEDEEEEKENQQHKGEQVRNTGQDVSSQTG